MSEEQPFTLRWGILSCGFISKTFCKDLLISPYPTSGIKHVVTACSTRDSLSRAQEFASSLTNPGHEQIKAYGSYNEMLSDPNIDIVYIGTPHSHHFEHVNHALDAGKHVLCEKAFTINAKQARFLMMSALARNKFLMEAMWTRFLPITKEIVKIVTSGQIGYVERIFSHIGLERDEKQLGSDHRLVDTKLGGGVLLDIGIYPLTWPIILLPTRPLPEIKASATLLSSGADAETSILLTYRARPSPSSTTESNGNGHQVETDVHCVVTASLHRTDENSPCIRIQCSEAELQVFGKTFAPSSFKIIPKDSTEPIKEVKETDLEVPGARGMYHQADECARCIRDGKIESDIMPLGASMVMMDVMDEIRRQCGIVYPPEIESADPPPRFSFESSSVAS